MGYCSWYDFGKFTVLSVIIATLDLASPRSGGLNDLGSGPGSQVITQIGKFGYGALILLRGNTAIVPLNSDREALDRSTGSG